MIIKSKPLKPFFFKSGAWLFSRLFKRRFNKMLIHEEGIVIKPGYSYILMCNHFSFWDGFWAFYLARKIFWGKGRMQRMYIMSLKKQMEKNRWLRYCGSFSVDPGKRSITESFDYAAEVLSQPGNLLMFFPQGKLESCHVRNIQFEAGLFEIMSRVKGNCQLIWSSNIIEYFESVKPTVHFNLLDCGTNDDFNFDTVKQQINKHHLTSLQRTVRYTQADIE